MLTFVALTGGPGGGKTTLIKELQRDPAWRERVLALPEAIWIAGCVGVSIQEPAFQRLMVETQFALEEVLSRACGSEKHLVLCHRGSLDPLAYWLDRGWDEASFFAFTHTTRQQHYARYVAVLHLVTAADGALNHYAHWPDAHRPEQPADAVHLDRLLERAWSDHPHYHRLDNTNNDWPAKDKTARKILETYLEEVQPCGFLAHRMLRN